LEKAFDCKKIEKIKNILVENLKDENIEITNFPLNEEIIIDIREEDKIKKTPLDINNIKKFKLDIKIIKIPFFEINNRFKNLDQKIVYLFYCDK
jgi:hypothetical protein